MKDRIQNSKHSYWKKRDTHIIKGPLLDERGSHSELNTPSMARKTLNYIEVPTF